MNRVELQRVTIESAALLVELNDADDVLDAQATTITTARGIGVRVAGTRNDTNEGGSVTFVGSTLLSTDKEATIHVLASEHSGKVRLVSTTVDTQGPLTVLAHDCEALLGGASSTARRPPSRRTWVDEGRAARRRREPRARGGARPRRSGVRQRRRCRAG